MLRKNFLVRLWVGILLFFWNFLFFCTLGFCELKAKLPVFSDEQIISYVQKGGDLKKYPDANSIVIFYHIYSKFIETGACRTQEYVLTKVLTKKGKEKLSSIKLEYYPLYQSIKFVKARLIKKDGIIKEVPLDEVMDVPSPTGTIFWGSRQKVLTLSDLEIGDAIEYQTEKIGTEMVILSPYDYTDDQLAKFTPPMPGQYYKIILFQRTEPILAKSYTLNGPEDKPIKYKVINGKLNYILKKEDDRIIHLWSAKNVPQIITEPMMVSLADVATKLVVTTIPDWEWISRWSFEISEPNMVADQAIKNKVKELTSGLTSDEEKMKALFYFVAQEIRYIGVSMGKGEGYTPHPASQTFKERGGVCKDKAGLLVTMLREAGFPAYYTLTEVGQRVEDIPADQFNHGIVAVARKEGGYIYLDPTIGQDGRDFLPSLEQLQYVLVATEKGEDLDMTPGIPPEKNLVQIKAKTVVTTDGSLESQLKLTFFGSRDQNFRRWVKSTPTEQREQIFLEVIHQICPRAKLESFSYSDVEDLYQPLKMEIKYTVEDYAFKTGNNLVFKMPLANAVSQPSYLLEAVGLEKRRYPLRIWSATTDVVCEEEIDLPSDYKVRALPDPVELDKSSSAFISKYERTQNQIKYFGELKVKKPQILPHEYPDFKKVIGKAKKSQREWVVLQCQKEMAEKNKISQ